VGMKKSDGDDDDKFSLGGGIVMREGLVIGICEMIILT